MSTRTWKRHLPPTFTLGGDYSLAGNTHQSAAGWQVNRLPQGDSCLSIRTRLGQEEFHFYPRISLQASDPDNPDRADCIPKIQSFSWDWIEICWDLRDDLNVHFLIWVPDHDLICAEVTCTNHADSARDVTIDLVGDFIHRSSVSRIGYGEIDGRTIITGNCADLGLTLFTSGNPQPGRGPLQFLRNQLSLQGSASTTLRWICLCSGEERSPGKRIKTVINRDWQGEISKRKVRDQSSIQIWTGNEDWDFALALSKKEAKRLEKQLFQSTDNHSRPGKITPHQGLVYLESLDFLPEGAAARLLAQIFDTDMNALGNTVHPAPQLMGAELLSVLEQRGLDRNLWSMFLPIVARELERWFSPRFDRDGDGIPELIHPEILGSFDQGKTDHLQGGGEWLPYPYLESPGLAAILLNELKKIMELDPSLALNLVQADERKIKDYIERSWDPTRPGFTYRDSWSHLSPGRTLIAQDLKPGFNLLRCQLQQASRVAVVAAKTGNEPLPHPIILYLHGLDRNGDDRVEEVNLSMLPLAGSPWHLTESVFQRIDFCVLDSNHPGIGIMLVTPDLQRDDLSLTLPFWALPERPDWREKLIQDVLFSENRFLAHYGLRMLPGSSSQTINLGWNLIIAQALHLSGRGDLAFDLFQRWMQAVLTNLEESGMFYSEIEEESGKGAGRMNCLESLLPLRFFLALGGIHLHLDKTIRIQGEYHLPEPIKVTIRGIEIYRDREHTIINQPGKDRLQISKREKITLKPD